MSRITQYEQFFGHTEVHMTKKSRRIVLREMHRKPYEGTKLEKELRDAKNRARANRHRDD